MRHRSAFIKFVYDTLTYCLDVVGLRWVPKDYPPGLYRDYFNKEYGDYVLIYRNAHDETYRNFIRRVPHRILLQEITLLQYVQNGANLCFDGSLMEGIFMLCAFLVDTSIFCFRYHRSHLIEISVCPCVGFVYDLYLEPMFKDRDQRIWAHILIKSIEIVKNE
ncbi:hypothetical protein TNIN_393661 [Trichonephila inaurata madagascariensis]|uniref:Uncharacterized protein n=1 Tax=Trichonephila inaurata madagascariensis TaxID=2747483 RepID=A0A8X7CQ91_9ARAC|nr:hypothetical protein TNIN_393661 [Trichonephila inaurata madagascariensis]